MRSVARNTLACRGFTLLEILIAMGILSILLVSVYGTFSSIHRAVETTDGTMTTMREARLFFELLTREVESSYMSGEAAFKDTFFYVKDRDVFGKRLSELAFTSFVPYGHGLFAVEYSLDPDRRTLMKKAVSIFGGQEPQAFEVLSGVEEFAVEVYTGGKWVGTYDGHAEGSLPSKVRARITLRVQGQLLPLEETITPQMVRS